MYYQITYTRPARKQTGYKKEFKTITVEVKKDDLPYWLNWLDFKGFNHIIN